ncbi:Putative phosphoribosyl transferase [archaeon HR04]|nr:Putative phosphoribosyl transferase [archaeon HR04]
MKARSVKIDVSRVEEGKGMFIEGDLTISSLECIVVFAHGSGSSRFSPRNRFVAGVLQSAGLSTLLLDLLTKEEDAIDSLTGRYRFDVELLASRLVDSVIWLEGEYMGSSSSSNSSSNLRIGYFGSSTGAAAALIAYARYPNNVRAIVSRGGRVDLAAHYLPSIKVPTLLIVGGSDTPVLRLNREAMDRFPKECMVRLEVISNATHLFEEQGALEQVAEKAKDWFLEHLR